MGLGDFLERLPGDFQCFELVRLLIGTQLLAEGLDCTYELVAAEIGE